MCHDQTGDVVHVTPSSKKRKAIAGRDRLTWRHTTNRRLLLCHGTRRNPLVTVEPDSKYTGMYRIRFPDGGLSDMVNLTRAKDAALVFILRSLNSRAQEMSPEGSYVRQKPSYRISCGGLSVRRRNSISGQFATRRIENAEADGVSRASFASAKLMSIQPDL